MSGAPVMLPRSAPDERAPDSSGSLRSRNPNRLRGMEAACLRL